MVASAVPSVGTRPPVVPAVGTPASVDLAAGKPSPAAPSVGIQLLVVQTGFEAPSPAAPVVGIQMLVVPSVGTLAPQTVFAGLVADTSASAGSVVAVVAGGRYILGKPSSETVLCHPL